MKRAAFVLARAAARSNYAKCFSQSSMIRQQIPVFQKLSVRSASSMSMQEVNSVADLDKFISSNEFVAIDFYTEWCAPCRMMNPVFTNLASKHPEVKFVKVDLEAPGMEGASQKFNISSVPHFAAVHNGSVIKSMVGSDRDLLEDMITFLKEDQAEEDSQESDSDFSAKQQKQKQQTGSTSDMQQSQKKGEKGASMKQTLASNSASFHMDQSQQQDTQNRDPLFMHHQHSSEWMRDGDTSDQREDGWNSECGAQSPVRAESSGSKLREADKLEDVYYEQEVIHGKDNNKMNAKESECGLSDQQKQQQGTNYKIEFQAQEQAQEGQQQQEQQLRQQGQDANYRIDFKTTANMQQQ